MSDVNQEMYYHGTHAELKPGDLIEAGYNSNYGIKRRANHVYLTATVDAAVWVQNWQKARVTAGFTSSSLRDPSKTTRT